MSFLSSLVIVSLVTVFLMFGTVFALEAVYDSGLENAKANTFENRTACINPDESWSIKYQCVISNKLVRRVK